MLGLIGVILSLVLLIFLAYRGINVIILAPLMALLATLLAGAPLLGAVLPYLQAHRQEVTHIAGL